MAVLFESSLWSQPSNEAALARVARYPRLRYMGSKYRVVPQLLDVISGLEPRRVLDAFSGSGVVSYALKANGVEVVANDFLNFAATIARATTENSEARLSEDQIGAMTSSRLDDRDFVRSTFAGLYFPPDDLAFIDGAWSHIDGMVGYERDIAISSLCLAASRKQPRGVFTVTDGRYDDGRRAMHTPLAVLFAEAAREYNATVFDNGRASRVTCGDVFSIDPDGCDVVYLDPPYAPPRDDNDYIKRYHFLEGLATYWRGQEILHNTMTKKIRKRPTPFGSKRTIRDALRRTFERFNEQALVLSYSTNSVPDETEIVALLKEARRDVVCYAVPHRYHFGTHSAATRRQANELIFVASR
ncbi:MAG: DNA adenine methylase [Chloroflexi bacterium]|nr:DNA adenine methylase [Chloroflexota bacterium]